MPCRDKQNTSCTLVWQIVEGLEEYHHCAASVLTGNATIPTIGCAVALLIQIFLLCLACFVSRFSVAWWKRCTALLTKLANLGKEIWVAENKKKPWGSLWTQALPRSQDLSRGEGTNRGTTRHTYFFFFCCPARSVIYGVYGGFIVCINYSPKWKQISTTFTDTEVNNCFSI